MRSLPRNPDSSLKQNMPLHWPTVTKMRTAAPVSCVWGSVVAPITNPQTYLFKIIHIVCVLFSLPEDELQL